MLEGGSVAVAEDDDVRRITLESFRDGRTNPTRAVENVRHVDPMSIELHARFFSRVAAGKAVDVSGDRRERSQIRELVENRGAADVAGVDDVIGGGEEAFGNVVEESVCVGDDADRDSREVLAHWLFFFGDGDGDGNGLSRPITSGDTDCSSMRSSRVTQAACLQTPKSRNDLHEP